MEVPGLCHPWVMSAPLPPLPLHPAGTDHPSWLCRTSEKESDGQVLNSILCPPPIFSSSCDKTDLCRSLTPCLLSPPWPCWAAPPLPLLCQHQWQTHACPRSAAWRSTQCWWQFLEWGRGRLCSNATVSLVLSVEVWKYHACSRSTTETPGCWGKPKNL